MQWDSEAIESINRAPGMIRQYIREQVEKYARERGFQNISLDVLQEAKSNLNECPVTKAAKNNP
jgi:light-independent protochlorophyllide reductase subunit B